MTTPQETGAHAANPKGGGLLWLWLLLGTVVLGLAVWAIVEALDDDELEAGLVETEPAEEVEEEVVVVDPEVEASETIAPTPDATTEEVAEPSADASPAIGAVLVAGDVDALAVDADLAGLAGQPVEATGVEVIELVADEAFFVGPEAGETIMVRLPAFAGDEAPESPFVVEEGDVLSFTGSLEEIDEALLSELQLYDAAEELETGDFYVQVDEIAGVG